MVRQASALSPPMLLIASSTFWPSARTPRTTSSEIEVALRSSRTRTTVPSRIKRTIGSPASERVFQASSHSSPCATSAHRVLADRPADQGRQRAAHPPRIGAGEIRTRDQCVGGECASLIGSQRLALPFRRLAVRSGHPGARHRDLDFALAIISIGPNVPVSDRVRLPWRWPATPALPSLPAIRLRP
jgi:hypothetical protein